MPPDLPFFDLAELIAVVDPSYDPGPAWDWAHSDAGTFKQHMSQSANLLQRYGQRFFDSDSSLWNSISGRREATADVHRQIEQNEQFAGKRRQHSKMEIGRGNRNVRITYGHPIRCGSETPRHRPESGVGQRQPRPFVEPVPKHATRLCSPPRRRIIEAGSTLDALVWAVGADESIGSPEVRCDDRGTPI